MLGMGRKLLLQMFHDVSHNSIMALKTEKKESLELENMLI